MAHLAESLDFVATLRIELAKGQSFKQALLKTIRHSDNEFSLSVLNWLKQKERGAQQSQVLSMHPLRLQMFGLFDQGLKGVPMSPQLESLENQIKEVCLEDVNVHLEKLPTLLMLPLVFCFLPAYMLLIIGPVLGAMNLDSVTL